MKLLLPNINKVYELKSQEKINNKSKYEIVTS